MSPALRVLACGPGTSVQDAGRAGLRRYGVALAGAADRLSHALANGLAGNPAGAAALEFAVAGARLVVEGGPVRLAATGAALLVDGRAVPPAAATDADPGAEVRLSAPERRHAYLAVSGGIATPPEMGSRALHIRSGLGGRPIAPGDVLPGASPPPVAPPRLADTLPETEGPIRVVRGPQDDLFADGAWEAFIAAEWHVHPRSDRMGIRLAGPALAHRAGADIVSDAVLPGAVQVPGEGRPIVLMRDCQTTGGYPKIACAIEADLDRIAQSVPGAVLRFAEISAAQGLAATQAYRALLRSLPSRLAPAGLAPERLHDLNLIDGVHDAGSNDPAP